MRPELAQYLRQTFSAVSASPIAGDASVRKFYRLTAHSGKTCVLMDYGGPFDGETDDARLARVFEAAGLPVAQVLDCVGEVGCVLLEDLGDTTLESVLCDDQGHLRPHARRHLEQAVRLAALLAERGSVALSRSPRRERPSLNAERFRFEMDYFLEHYVKGLRGRTSIPDSLRGELHDLAERAASTPKRVLCHRDFHSRNLMVLGDGTLAMVDIQDARWGPDSYDLASLLRDAYVDIDEDWVEPMIALYLATLAEPPAAGAFRERFHVVAAQRMIKALGTFGYQIGVMGRERYQPAATRTLERLRRVLGSRPEAQQLVRALREAEIL
jgi:hypothetical protein